jgi:8-oxo-dGTP diphosphatase
MAEYPEKNRRWYPEHPWVGVGAAVIRDGRLLMVKRGNEPNQGKWSIPGGAIELGETLQEAAVREVLEECSVRIEIERILDAAQNIIRDEKGRVKFHFVLVDFIGRYVSGETKARSDAEECRWVPLEEIENMDITAALGEMLKWHKII